MLIGRDWITKMKIVKFGQEENDVNLIMNRQ